mgnify:CR=1 FL=1
MLDSRWASIDAFAENNRDNILRDITRLVAVPSVEGTPEPGAPFGKGPKAALDKALEIAAELGLDTHNAEGYIGWAQTGPIADGQKYLATITHTDVVPEGNGWDADPYTVRVRDGWLLGRGVADDKGPSILCLYALKYLKDNGVTLKYPVRALLGANEETNMHDVDYFAAHFEQPAFCFTPDAEFPVCNGEKGGFGGELVSPVLENGVIVDFIGRRCPQRCARPRSLHRPPAGKRPETDRRRPLKLVRTAPPSSAAGQKRPRRHAARHRKRHWADRYLPAGKQGLLPGRDRLSAGAAHPARHHGRQRLGHCRQRRCV